MTDDKSIIRIVDVHFSYPSQVHSLFAGLSLEVPDKAIMALLGRSGCGKTTLLHLLAGYLLPLRGKCYFGDAVISGPAACRVPIFHEDALWPWMRVAENVALGPLLSEGRPAVKQLSRQIAMMLSAVGLSQESSNRYPKELSAGMRKRVEIARALFQKPRVILGDEPFASLDPDTRGDLHRLVLDLWAANDMTMVFTTHDIEEALVLASDIVVLHPGGSTIVAGVFRNPFHGRTDAKRTDPEAYFQLVDAIRETMRNGTANE